MLVFQGGCRGERGSRGEGFGEKRLVFVIQTYRNLGLFTEEQLVAVLLQTSCFFNFCYDYYFFNLMLSCTVILISVVALAHPLHNP